MSGGEIERELKKLASTEWKTFNDEMKQHWKEQAIVEWEENGGSGHDYWARITNLSITLIMQ